MVAAAGGSSTDIFRLKRRRTEKREMSSNWGVSGGLLLPSEAAEQLSGRAEHPPPITRRLSKTLGKNMKSHRGFHKFIDAFLRIQYNFTIAYQVGDKIFKKKKM